MLAFMIHLYTPHHNYIEPYKHQELVVILYILLKVVRCRWKVGTYFPTLFEYKVHVMFSQDPENFFSCHFK